MHSSLTTSVYSKMDTLNSIMSEISDNCDLLSPYASLSKAAENIVKTLLLFHKGKQADTFVQNAVESLVRRLKDKPEELKALILSVTTLGAVETSCVTVARTLDGRLQISGRKCFPHIVFAKIWRWPDLDRDEISHLPNCQYAFDLKQTLICLNPYHYKREVKSTSKTADQCKDQRKEIFRPKNAYFTNSCTNQMMPNESSFEQLSLVNASDLLRNTNDLSNRSRHQNIETIDISSSTSSGISYGLSEYSSANDLTNFALDLSSSSRAYAQTSNMNNRSNSSIILNGISNSPPHSGIPLTTSLNSYNSAGTHDMSNGIDSLSSSVSNEPAISSSNSILPSNHNLIFPENWCSIAYNEHDKRVGETFYVPNRFPSVQVDGYTETQCKSRFCLSSLFNVHRTAQSEKTLMHIGKGIHLELKGEGDVWLRCLSDHPVFVQSNYLDEKAGRARGAVIHKIFPGAYIKVFDLYQCKTLIRQKLNQPQDALLSGIASILGASSSSNDSDEDDFRYLCVLRLSFVKGWGPDYPRLTIKETPCWIEIRMHRAFRFLDSMLHTNYSNKLE